MTAICLLTGREGGELTCLDGQQVGDAVQVCQAVLGISRLQLGLSLDGDNLQCSHIETQGGGRGGVLYLGLILDENDSLLGPGVAPVHLTNLARLSRSEVGGECYSVITWL